jgi:hypothetical protein
VVTVIPENDIATEQKVEEKVNIDISNDTNDKNFIGDVDRFGKYTEIQIGKIDTYEKYIVLEELLIYGEDKSWNDSRFCIYEYDKDLEITDYKDSGIKLYTIGDGPYRYDGIYNDLLFIDEGTDVGVRGIHIFDLANKEEILDAAYYRSYSFENNIVSGLVMSNCREYDDKIKTKFYEIMQSTEVPEKDYGLSTRFVVDYNFNVLTKEINLTYGTYIFEQ